MNKIVLDASAMIAVLNNEAGADKLTPELLVSSISSTVNVCEVQTKLILRGMSAVEAWDAAMSTVGEAVDFTAEHAQIAGALVTETRPLGLSLGDRACMALGLALNAPIYTAERSWKNVKTNARIHIIR